MTVTAKLELVSGGGTIGSSPNQSEERAFKIENLRSSRKLSGQLGQNFIGLIGLSKYIYDTLVDKIGSDKINEAKNLVKELEKSGDSYEDLTEEQQNLIDEGLDQARNTAEHIVGTFEAINEKLGINQEDLNTFSELTTSGFNKLITSATDLKNSFVNVIATISGVVKGGSSNTYEPNFTTVEGRDVYIPPPTPSNNKTGGATPNASSIYGGSVYFPPPDTSIINKAVVNTGLVNWKLINNANIGGNGISIKS